MMQNLRAGLSAAKDQVDLLPQRLQNAIVLAYEHKDKVALATVALLVVVVVAYVSKKLGVTRWILTATGILDPEVVCASDKGTDASNHNRAKYMVRESARLIADALAKRQANPVEAYEQALQAAVLARTAKELEDDPSQLSEDLGVEFLEYLSYTTTVLQEMRKALWK